MALGKRHNYSKHRGDEYDLDGSLVKADGITIEDLSAATGGDLEWNFSLADSGSVPKPSGVALLSPAKTIGAGITIVDGPAGEWTVVVVSADTNGLAAARYYHELQYTSPTGRVSTILYGWMTLLEDLVAPGP